MDLVGSGQEPVVESFERGKESLGSIKGRDFLVQLSDC
jgi:hypothetical protein